MRALLLALATLAAAQTPPAFEVASVKAAAPARPGQGRANRVLPGRVDFPFATLRYAIAYAYGVKEYQVSGPSWLAADRWEILARADPSQADRMPEMMQALLTERFRLAVHRPPPAAGCAPLLTRPCDPCRHTNSPTPL